MGPQLRKPTSYLCTAKPKAASSPRGRSLSHSVPGLKPTDYCRLALLLGEDQESKAWQVLLGRIFLDDVCKVLFSSKGGQEETKWLLRGLWTGKSHLLLRQNGWSSQSSGFRLRERGWSAESETLRRVRTAGGLKLDPDCFPGPGDDVTFCPSEKERGGLGMKQA